MTNGHQRDEARYEKQGFGNEIGIAGGIGLLIVDFVNGFADPDAFGGGNIPQAMERTRTLLAEARHHGWKIAHTRIVFADDGSDANIFSMKVPSMLGLTENNPASAIVPELAPLPGEYVVRKTVPSAFAGTPLAAWFVTHGVQTVVVAGCVTSGCVRASVLDAMQAGFRPVIVSDCVGDRAIGPHEANLFDMAQKCGDVMSLETLLSRISDAQ
ncbi:MULTISPECIES: isochorismatase family protein [Acetobacter]|uniref:Isochorismatase family protein n=2 Tax=Acetobacter thailandicus TaxID=1502842 RepID=A0ABT3QD25_9PROT|nr:MULTISPECIES: isochorismatase family protein [Acetobacter]MBS0986254.1 isochorismatase family protein [Acetobacter thailandicus]MCX2563165.1 isochorismatase family protein [Acetobacter thailandicus]NHN93921.1 isochorismatase family protein [Acetobacter thailandicus]OUI88312.1 N-carbamoylsarcosine amidase [Acetobacter sp. DmW_043]